MNIMHKVKSVFGILFLVIIVSGCLVKSSPAPACNKYFPPIIAGGCSSKYAVIDIKMDPQISCLGFDYNNCQKPELYLTNGCEEPVYINGNEISKRYSLVGSAAEMRIISEVKRRSGEDVLDSYFAGFEGYPNENKEYTLNGVVGDEKFTISFTVTKELC